MRQSQRVHVSVNENAAGRVLIYRTGGVRLTGLPPCDRRSPLAFLLSSTHLTTRRRHFHHVAERLAITVELQSRFVLRLARGRGQFHCFLLPLHSILKSAQFGVRRSECVHIPGCFVVG